jgi:hypothetical protein
MAEDLAQNTLSAPLALRVHEACRLTGIGRSKLLIGAGQIRILKGGSITLIPFAGA